MNTPPNANLNLAGKQMSSSLKARLKRLKRNRTSNSPYTTPLSSKGSSSKKVTDKLLDHGSPVALQFNISSEVLDCDINFDSNVNKCNEVETFETCQPSTSELDNCNDLKRLQKWKQEYKERLEIKKEKLRKLKMAKMYRIKNNPEELTSLIQKWREVSQQALQDLLEKMPEPKPKLSNLLNHFQIEKKLLNYNSEEESFE